MLYNKVMIFLFNLVFILYQEVLYKLSAANNFYISIVNSFFYYVAIAAFLTLIYYVIPNKISKHVFRLLTFLITFWYGACTLVRKTFDICLALDSVGMADQIIAGGFIEETIDVITSNILLILVMLIPFGICIVISIFYNHKRIKISKIITYALTCVICFGLFIGSLFVDIENYGLKDLYFNKRNNKQNVEYFGVMPSLLIDIRKELTGFKETITIEEIEEDPIVEIEYEKQIEDIDFNSLIESTTDSTLSQLHTYFKSEKPTYTNEYTGLFEGKNLIYIMAESFDGYMVSQELTPTLYKMIHNGFDFENYYSTTNLSTIGGEFQELTGLLPDLQMLSWKWRQQGTPANYYPYGLGNVFNDLGYNTYAYHNHDYTFQDRYKYLQAIGFDNFLGCGNGLEKKGVTCSIFPESDDELILKTYQDYINDENFMVYYATVSGHMSWEFINNDMAIKHQSEVSDIDKSTSVKAFIAANLELEKAMTSLLQVLQENGRLDDTVIVLAADHHPYGLSTAEMCELAGKEVDETFEIYHNNLIIYNPEVEHTTVTKPCATIDVLPTTLNLFGVKYDSRLLSGKDIFNNDDGLVIFSSNSWLTSKGKYNANTKSFNAFDYIDEKYVDKMNNAVTNRLWAAKYIMYYNYYNIVLGNNN